MLFQNDSFHQASSVNIFTAVKGWAHNLEANLELFFLFILKLSK